MAESSESPPANTVGNEMGDTQDDGGDYGCETEMKFEQGGVSQRFPVNGKLRNSSILIPGKLYITENRFGEYLEWKPVESRSSSPFVTGYPELHGSGGSSGGIGYRPGKSDEESVEFLRDPKETEYRRPIKVELSELRSFVVTPKNATREVIFFHSDGTILNTFVFERGSPENFITALERSVSIKKSKDRSKNLFLICPKVETVPNVPRPGIQIPPEVADLFPTQLNQISHIWGFVKEFKNDPYTTGCTALAKLAHNTLNGEMPSVFHKHDDSSSEEQSPVRNIRNEDGCHSDGLDADYATNEEGYEVIFTPDNPGIDLPPRPQTFRGQPLSQEQWLNYLDNEGRVTNMEDIRSIVFRGGVDPEIRKHVWPLILGVYEASSTYEERKKQYSENSAYYNRMKLQWMTITEDQEERFFAFRDIKSLIDKDVNRTDRAMEYFTGDDSAGVIALRNILMTYMMYNFNLGYVQGMSDVLAPILMEIQDEILAFWLFVKFMERIHTNFEMSQEGMQNQLRYMYILLQLVDPKFSAYLDACDASNMFFGFRWLLIIFKREFRHPDVLTLWECVWTSIPGPNFQLFIGLAILEANRDTVMTNKYGLSEILRHVNDLNLRIPLEDTLTAAEGIYRQVLAVQDQLPNPIRKIIGLQEIPEPQASTSDHDSKSRSASSTAASSRPPTSNGAVRDNAGDEHSAAGPANSEEQTLENQYELGLNQFY